MVNNKISDRIDMIIRELGLNKNSFSKVIGLDNNVTIGRIVNEERSPSYEVLNKIIQTYGSINANWLLTGNGSMFTKNDNPSYKAINSEEGAPLLPVSAMAGLGSGYTSPVMDHEVEERYIIPEFKGKVDFYVRVTGTSMQPMYNSGDIVACKHLENIPFIQWNKTYVLDTLSQGALVKRLFQGINKNTIICRSDNPDYPDFTIQYKEIRAIALIIGVIRFE